MKTALYTGSFDPITKGHLDIIQRSAQIFSKVIVGVGTNPAKKYLFTTEERIKFIRDTVFRLPNVEVIEIADGRLAADVAYELNAVIVKGVRINADFDYERMMHDINLAHNQKLDTIIYPCQPHLSHVSSSAAKEVCKLHGNTQDFVPLNVKAALERVLVGQTRVALTGTIGVGKSTIMRALENMSGVRSMECLVDLPTFHNIDLDIIAHDILFVRTEPSYVELRERLRSMFMMKTWDKKALGKLVFGDPEFRDIINMEIRQPLMTRIRAELLGKKGVVIFNSALLCESEMLYLTNNRVVLLDVSQKDQTERLRARGYTDEQIKQRVNAQNDTNQKECIINERIDKDGFGMIMKINTSDLDVNQCAFSIANFCQKVIT